MTIRERCEYKKGTGKLASVKGERSACTRAESYSGRVGNTRRINEAPSVTVKMFRVIVGRVDLSRARQSPTMEINALSFAE